MGKKAKAKDKARKKERKKAAALAAAEAAAAEAAALQAAADPLAGSPQVEAQRAESRADAGRTTRHAVGSTELAARLAGLSTVLQRHLARADAGEGLTRARLSALALLVLGGPRTLGELAAAEHVRPPTMTRLVHAMEADGLVARERNPSDGRSIIIRATATGEEQLERGRVRQIAPLAESIAALQRAEQLRLEDASDLLGRVLRDSSWEPAETPE